MSRRDASSGSRGALRALRGLLLALLALPVLAGAPARVVCQVAGADELVMALADPGQIAALSHLARDASYSPRSREAAAFPCLRSGAAEDVLSRRPDLVVVAPYTLPETLALLRRAKVPLLMLDRFESLEDLYQSARSLGRALGKPERAEALVGQWRKRVADLQVRLAGVRPVRVLAAGLYPFTAGSGTTFQDLCDHAGALNVAAEAGLSGHQPTPAERVLGWRVEVLVGAAEPGMDLPARLREMAPYRHMEALRKGRLVVLPSALLGATGQSRLDAYEALARALHPEAFR